MAEGQAPTRTVHPAQVDGAGRLRVFLSYSRDDIDFADQLVAALETTGFDVTLDRHGITGGEDFQRRLGSLIREADTVVFLLSPSSAASGMCAWEVAEAVQLGKRILPVVCRALDGTEPPATLKNLDYVFFYAEPKVLGSGFGHGLQRLVAALNTDLDWLREHTRLLARAGEWHSAGRLENRMLSGADIAAAKDWAAKRPKGAPEPTALQLEYIRASEGAQDVRLNVERQRLEEMAAAQAEREAALQAAEAAQRDKDIAARKLVRRTLAGMVVAVVLALAACAAGYVAWQNQQVAEMQRQRAEKNLDAINDALAVLDNTTDPRQVAGKILNLADTYYSQQRVDESILLYRRSLSMAGNQGSAEGAVVSRKLAMAYVDLGNYPAAEPLLKDALALHERQAGQHPDVPVIVATLDKIHGLQKKSREAAETKTRAREAALRGVASEVAIFFGTDRVEVTEKGTGAGYGYSHLRARRLQLGRALVSVPNSHRGGNVERPMSLNIPYFDVPLYKQPVSPASHFVMQDLTPMAQADFGGAIKAQMTQPADRKPHAVIYVHGASTSFETGIFRAASLAQSLELEGSVFAYSWPAGDRIVGYTSDRESAGQAEPFFTEFVAKVSSESGATRLSVIATGMANGTVLQALRSIKVPFEQLILVTPDVDRDNFAALVSSLEPTTKGITLYASSSDRELVVARKLYGGMPRAGDGTAEGPLILPGMDSIDVTAAPDGFVTRDIVALLKTGERPPDRRSRDLKSMTGPAGKFWSSPRDGGMPYPGSRAAGATHHAGFEAGERGGERVGARRLRRRCGARTRWRNAWRHRGLQQAQISDGAVAEVAVDAVDDLRGLVFHVEGARGIDAQHQGGAGAAGVARSVLAQGDSVNAARPLHAFRQRDGGDVVAGDDRPIGEQRGGGEAVFLEGLLRQLGHEAADRLGGDVGGGTHRRHPCAGRTAGKGRRSRRGHALCCVLRHANRPLGPRRHMQRAPAMLSIDTVIRDSTREDRVRVVSRRQLPLRPAGPDTVAALLDWYDRERRDLPWRAKKRQKADPYAVWLSEIMLQQTTVKAVIPYFLRFLQRWPSVTALAAAPLDDVLAAWAGLGYYSRARNLHTCAVAVARDHGGRFPDTEEGLRALPGIGPYTAAAIAAIAFGVPATPVDGNIERVVARLFSVRKPLPAAKGEIKRLAATLTPHRRAGDFAQAMMDLGAAICTPRKPSCLMCPLQTDCAAHAAGIEAQLPLKLAKAQRPVRYGTAFLVLREDGDVLLRRRPDAGLLGGMLEVPSTDWLDDWLAPDMASRAAPVHGDWWPVPGVVSHTFTHFRLDMMVLRAIVPPEATLTFWADADRCRWVKRRDLASAALPSVMRKVIAHALKEQ
jgi:A/G-specific adenine glycosylase